MPVMKSSNEEFLSKVEKIVQVEDVNIGFESGTKNGKSFLGFTIQINDPNLNIGEEQKTQSLADEIERVVNQEILNLNEYDLYKVIFTSKEIDGSIEKRRQIIITKML
ncbi:hypothetical protein NMS_2024 [Nonlabens marinus S1-08]|uniref:Uncharacterized protein n=2 Tax=Nonlabens TaxID=363408 RepID=W8VW55_9FLAO|nr:hypothetical protein NMS_2024 [Nonlabens marinus S1-08]